MHLTFPAFAYPGDSLYPFLMFQRQNSPLSSAVSGIWPSLPARPEMLSALDKSGIPTGEPAVQASLCSSGCPHQAEVLRSGKIPGGVEIDHDHAIVFEKAVAQLRHWIEGYTTAAVAIDEDRRVIAGKELTSDFKIQFQPLPQEPFRFRVRSVGNEELSAAGIDPEGKSDTHWCSIEFLQNEDLSTRAHGYVGGTVLRSAKSPGGKSGVLDGGGNFLSQFFRDHVQGLLLKRGIPSQRLRGMELGAELFERAVFAAPGEKTAWEVDILERGSGHLILHVADLCGGRFVFYPTNPAIRRTLLEGATLTLPGGSADSFPGAVGVIDYRPQVDHIHVVGQQMLYRTHSAGEEIVPAAIHKHFRHHASALWDAFFVSDYIDDSLPVYFEPQSGTSKVLHSGEMKMRRFLRSAKRAGYSELPDQEGWGGRTVARNPERFVG